MRHALAILLCSASAHAEPVDRVVARVDGAPILLSELRRATRPALAALHAEPAWKRARVLRDGLRAARESAIESALLAERAKRLGIVVTDAEVDAALVRIAADQKLGRAELLAEARAAGYPEAAYRAELRRQLVQQRVLFAGPFGAAGPPPRDGAALRRWLENRQQGLLAELRRRACVERLGRF